MPTPKKSVRRSQVTQQQSDEDVQDVDVDDATDENEDETEATTDGSDDAGTTDQESTPEPVQDRMMGAPRDGRVFRAGEQIVFKGVKKGGVIISSENLYRGVKAPNSERYRFHLIVSKGGEIPASNAKEISEGEYKATTQL